MIIMKEKKVPCERLVVLKTMPWETWVFLTRLQKPTKILGSLTTKKIAIQKIYKFPEPPGTELMTISTAAQHANH